MTAEIRETQIRLNLSFVLVLTLMMIFCQESVVIMSAASSLLHEGGHLLFMKLFGEKILSVDFGAFGVRIERTGKANLSYKTEGLIALGGIFVNFLLAFLSIMYYYLMKRQNAVMFSLINLLIAAFNCLPVSLLDMGRALRCFLLMKYDEDKTVRILTAVSAVCVNLLAVGCCLYSAFVSVNPSLIAVTVYLYIITLFKKWS